MFVARLDDFFRSYDLVLAKTAGHVIHMCGHQVPFYYSPSFLTSFLCFHISTTTLIHHPLSVHHTITAVAELMGHVTIGANCSLLGANATDFASDLIAELARLLGVRRQGSQTRSEGGWMEGEGCHLFVPSSPFRIPTLGDNLRLG